MNVSATFTMRLMSNHSPKMTQVPIEINGNLLFLKFGIVKVFKNLYNVTDVKNLLPQIKKFEYIKVLLFLI